MSNGNLTYMTDNQVNKKIENCIDQSMKSVKWACCFCKQLIHTNKPRQKLSKNNEFEQANSTQKLASSHFGNNKVKHRLYIYIYINKDLTMYDLVKVILIEKGNKLYIYIPGGEGERRLCYLLNTKTSLQMSIYECQNLFHG